jgi:hypothetical protein
MAQITKTTTKSPISVDDIYVGKFQKQGTLTAMLRQKFTTVAKYPTAVHDSDMQDNIFSSSDFGDTTKDFTSVENRVAFIDVPEGTTKEAVVALLARIPEATLYKVLSNAPILTNNHQNAIDRGLTTLDDIANSQVVRYGENHDNAGQLIMEAGKVQYRKVYFSKTAKADIDRRNSESHPEYMSAEIALEATGEVSVETATILEDNQVID